MPPKGRGLPDLSHKKGKATAMVKVSAGVQRTQVWLACGMCRGGDVLEWNGRGSARLILIPGPQRATQSHLPAGEGTQETHSYVVGHHVVFQIPFISLGTGGA